MAPVAFRVGLLLACCSKGSWVGVVVTASHNPIDDNGIKLVHPQGGLPPPEWEQLAMDFANCDEEELPALVSQHLQVHSSPEGGASARQGMALARPPKIFLAFDTRPSSGHLAELIRDSSKLLGAVILVGGRMSTPKCHYLTQVLNQGNLDANAYEVWLRTAFQRLEVTVKVPIVIDCANGVGANTANFLSNILPTVTFINAGEGVLNEQCGADFVKTTGKPPQSIDDATKCATTHYVSFDGDADRIVYFYFDASNGELCLLDGDYIAALLAVYVCRKLKEANQSSLSIGVVQTAYANGASTAFIGSLGPASITIVCASTGVKNLHRAASAFDIGIYFEANGHGTVLFSERARAALPGLASISNQLVGDAISDLLMVELALSELDMSLEKWARLYRPLPSRLLKVAVHDRAAFVTEDADRRLVSPAGLQKAIDKIVKGASSGGVPARAFVRPSGTEDVVRIFAEAATQEDADSIASKIEQLVLQLGK